MLLQRYKLIVNETNTEDYIKEQIKNVKNISGGIAEWEKIK